MIEVKEVRSKKEQREFLNFPLDLYAGNKNFIPPLFMDERKIFRKDYVYNSSCDSVCYNAYLDGKIAGRIQCIIQKDANAKNGEKRARFTRYDVIDNLEVSRALFEKAEAWAREQGMDTIVGPLSFSDLEKEGMLVEGFDVLATFEEQYNAPYYQEHVEALGFVKEIDWTGSFLYGAISDEDYEEMCKLQEFIFKRYGLRFGPAKNGKDFIKRYADDLFELLDKSYDGLYGTVPFTDGMRKLMIDNFSLVVDPRWTAVILDKNDKVVCFGVAIPALAPVLSGTRGRLTPKTVIKLLKALKKPEIIDLCIIGVEPEYLNRGISAAFSVAIMKMLKDNPDIKYADTNLNLEDNWAIQNQWKRFKRDVVKRYRCYVKSL